MPPLAKGHLRPVSAGARTTERFPYDGEVVLCRMDVARTPLEQNTGKASGGTMAVVEVNKDLYEHV
jgi:hypothetical protein